MANHMYLFWVCIAAYAVHLLEELFFDWKSWANKTLGLPADSKHLYFVNATAMMLGVCCAMISWWHPEISLMFPAFLIVNAVFLHVLPAISQKHFLPGLVSAILLLLPAAGKLYYGAYEDGKLSTQNIVVSALGGVAFVIFVLLLVKMKDRLTYRA